jgi:N,N'-diacetyllegionaminate synthase
MENKFLEVITQEKNEYYFIAETSYNHEGGLDYLYKMVDEIARLGMDAVKFHLLLKLESYMAKDHELFSKIGDCMFSEEDWQAVIRHSVEKGLEVVALCDDVESIEFVLEKKLPVAAIELHATCLNDHFMLQRVSEFKGVLVLGIGGSEMDEIEHALKILKENGVENILLMYGFQSFPTDYHKINLRKILTIEERFKVPVGYTDHTLFDDENNEFLSVIGFALGARVLEKHYTPDWGVERLDYQSACNKDQFLDMKRKLDVLKAALGDGKIEVSKEEKDYGKTGPMKKAIVAKKNIAKGEVIKYDDLWFKRTGKVSPVKQRQIGEIVGKKAARDINEEELTTFEDLE